MTSKSTHMVYGGLLSVSLLFNAIQLVANRKTGDQNQEPGSLTFPLFSPSANSATNRSVAKPEVDNSSLQKEVQKHRDEVRNLKKQLTEIQRSRHDAAEEAYLKTSDGISSEFDILLGGGTHGIEPQDVRIGRLPDSKESLESFIPGTIWSWGANERGKPGDLGEYVVFLDDGTMFGSWGLRYRYYVTSDLMIEWWQHKLMFGRDFQGFKVEGKKPRVGRLLQKIEGEELTRARDAVSHIHVVLPEDEFGQPETLPEKLE